MSKPRYFKGTNIFIPDPYWWIDPAAIAACFIIGSGILVALGIKYL
jgi:hypothetical protein